MSCKSCKDGSSELTCGCKEAEKRIVVSTGEPVNDVEIKDISIIAFHEDPGFQQALKELLFKPENQELLLKYE